MIRMLSMSVRLGMLWFRVCYWSVFYMLLMQQMQTLVLVDILYEAIKQVMGVLRARGCLWMVLDGENGFPVHLNAFQ